MIGVSEKTDFCQVWTCCGPQVALGRGRTGWGGNW